MNFVLRVSGYTPTDSSSLSFSPCIQLRLLDAPAYYQVSHNYIRDNDAQESQMKNKKRRLVHKKLIHTFALLLLNHSASTNTPHIQPVYVRLEDEERTETRSS